MAASGTQTIQLYYSTTSGTAPVAGNLASGELAINITDGKLYYKDNGGTVQTLATKDATSGSFSSITVSGTATLSGGTANGVLYLNGSKVATSGSALTFDGTFYLGLTGAMKINSNGYKLRFYDATGATGYGYLYTDGTNLQFDSGNTQPLSFLINGTEGMRLTSTGLGIGTSSPAYKLDVAGTSARLGGGGSYPLYLVADSNGLQLFNASGGATGDGVYLNGTSHYLGFYTNSAEKMRLDSSGNLGIGTSSPSAQLQVNKSGTGDYSTFRLSNSGASGKTFEIGVGGNAAAAGYANSLYFYDSTAGALRMTLDSSGNLGLGTSSITARAEIQKDSAAASPASDQSFPAWTSGLIAKNLSTTNGAYTALSLLTANAAGTTQGYSLVGQSTSSGYASNLLFVARTASGSGTVNATLDSSGNLGLGVTPSAWISSGKAIDINAFCSVAQTSSGSLASTFNAYQNSAANWIYKTTNAAAQYQCGLAGTGQHAWFTAASGTAGTAITFTQAMTLDASGRLLLGTTSASGSNYLQVNSDALISGLTVGKGAGAVSTNTAVGASALAANTSGAGNSTFGYQAGTSLTTGSYNSAFGNYALATSQTVNYNTAFGHYSLNATTTGAENSGLGANTLFYNTTGSYNVAVGRQSLFNNTTASYNTAVGYQAAYTNTTGYDLCAFGGGALYANTTGISNAAVGRYALNANTTGSQNSGFGHATLYLNTTGSNNTATGYQALFNNTTSSYNTAVGYQSLYANTGAGERNTAVGYTALSGNTTGIHNSALGMQTLTTNSTGSYNTAYGSNALASNTTASNNTAVGYQAGYYNTTGTRMTMVGTQAGYSSSTNNYGVYVGYQSGYYVSGDLNVAVGDKALFGNAAGSTATQCVAIGQGALAGVTSGNSMVGIGYNVLAQNTTGTYNVAVGQAALFSNTTASNNTAVGYQAGYSNTTGTNSVFVGYQAGYGVTGSYNHAFGYGAMSGAATTGVQNTAIARFSLNLLTSGSYNVAIGDYTLQNTTTGSNNVAVGLGALQLNTTASYNTAVGRDALQASTTASQNTAVGYGALYNTTTGSNNVAVGGLGGSYTALNLNTTGNYNTALGNGALGQSTTATSNTAIGYQAGYANATGNYNTFLGYQAGYNSSVSGSAFNTCIGVQAGYSLSSGTNNTFIGINSSGNGSGSAVTSGSKNTILGGYTGNQGSLDIRTSNNYIVLSDGDGNPRANWNGAGQATFTNGTSDYNLTLNTPSGQYTSIYLSNAGSIKSGLYYDNTNVRLYVSCGTGGVYLANNATSWTANSDERLKNVTGEISNGLSKVCSLRAAEFTWKADATNKPQVGLIAQEVQAVLPEAVTSSSMKDDETNTQYLGVAYTDVIPLLVAAIKELKAEVDSLKSQLKGA